MVFSFLFIILYHLNLIQNTYNPGLSQRKELLGHKGKEGEMSDVIVKVISQKRTCAVEHKVGDEFAIGQQTPFNLCLWAFYSLFPFAAVLQFDGSFL